MDKKDYRDNWINFDYRKAAKKLVTKRKEWEKEQIKQGKKEVRIPHPTIRKTFIIKYL